MTAARTFPGLLARFDFTMASMIALVHANTPLLVICPAEACASNEWRWLNTQPVVFLSLTPPVQLPHTTCARNKRISLAWSRGPNFLYDSFDEIPRPRQHSPPCTMPVRGACGKYAAVVYISVKYTTASVPAVYYARTRCVRQIRSGGVYKLKYTTASVLACMATSTYQLQYSFRLRDGFPDSPGKCQHALASFMIVRGMCSEYAAVVYLRLKYTTGGVFSITVILFFSTSHMEYSCFGSRSLPQSGHEHNIPSTYICAYHLLTALGRRSLPVVHSC